MIRLHGTEKNVERTAIMIRIVLYYTLIKTVITPDIEQKKCRKN